MVEAAREDRVSTGQTTTTIGINQMWVFDRMFHAVFPEEVERILDEEGGDYVRFHRIDVDSEAGVTVKYSTYNK